MQLRAAWGTPCVQFGVGGWVALLAPDPPLPPGDGSLHCPGLNCAADAPAITVATFWQTMNAWAPLLSHELMEKLADPAGDDAAREVCDPVQTDFYSLDGVTLSDFVLPPLKYGGPAPYDEIGKLTAARLKPRGATR